MTEEHCTIHPCMIKHVSSVTDSGDLIICFWDMRYNGFTMESWFSNTRAIAEIKVEEFLIPILCLNFGVNLAWRSQSRFNGFKDWFSQQLEIIDYQISQGNYAIQCVIHQDSVPQRGDMSHVCSFTWCRHQMETFSALLAICAGNSPVPYLLTWIILTPA